MTIRLQKILLPTDFSKYSAVATKYASELARKFDAELQLLHCCRGGGAHRSLSRVDRGARRTPNRDAMISERTWNSPMN
jgi:nucleotide-binding universal stress UspA family protein